MPEKKKSKTSTAVKARYNKMDSIEKALRNLADALKSNDTVERVKVTITLVKPKSSKAKTESK